MYRKMTNFNKIKMRTENIKKLIKKLINTVLLDK